MKKYLNIQLITLCLTVLMLSSCSYTNKTGSSKQFSKKHYNRGIVKHKSVKKKDSEKLALNKEEKLSRKEKKQALKEQLYAHIESNNLTTSSTETPNLEKRNSVKDVIENNFADARADLTAQKENASSEREKKKLDKKLNKIDKFETMLSKVSEKVEEKRAGAPSAPIAAKSANSGTIGLLGGIFGIVGFVFVFIPYIWFLGLLLCIAAIVLGAIGLKGENKGWAIAGIALGALGVLLFFLAFLVLFATLL